MENAERVDLEIREIVDEISRIRGVSAVILFGSYSREEFGEGSDIDLLILFGDGRPPAQSHNIHGRPRRED